MTNNSVMRGVNKLESTFKYRVAPVTVFLFVWALGIWAAGSLGLGNWEHWVALGPGIALGFLGADAIHGSEVFADE